MLRTLILFQKGWDITANVPNIEKSDHRVKNVNRYQRFARGIRYARGKEGRPSVQPEEDKGPESGSSGVADDTAES